jgi:hypothetical protein
MSAKISLDFGNDRGNHIPVEKAELFFSGCTDAFIEMGLFEHRRLVDLVEVIRVYPNQGAMSEGEVIVEVVVSGASYKRRETFTVYQHKSVLRKYVKDEIVRLTESLAQQIRKDTEKDLKEFSDRLKEQLDSSATIESKEQVGLGTNGGVKCDTQSGPCACGAWH